MGVEHPPGSGVRRPARQSNRIDVPFADVRVIRVYHSVVPDRDEISVMLSDRPGTEPLSYCRALEAALLTYRSDRGRLRLEDHMMALDVLCPNLVRPDSATGPAPTLGGLARELRP